MSGRAGRGRTCPCRHGDVQRPAGGHPRVWRAAPATRRVRHGRGVADAGRWDGPAGGRLGKFRRDGAVVRAQAIGQFGPDDAPRRSGGRARPTGVVPGGHRLRRFTAGGLGLDEAIARARERDRTPRDAPRGRRGPRPASQSALRPNPTATFEGRREPAARTASCRSASNGPWICSGVPTSRHRDRAVTAWSRGPRARAHPCGDVGLQYGRARRYSRGAGCATSASTVERQLGSCAPGPTRDRAPARERLLEVELRRLQAARLLAYGVPSGPSCLKPLLGMVPSDALALREPIDVLVATRAAATVAAATATIDERSDVGRRGATGRRRRPPPSTIRGATGASTSGCSRRTFG